LELSIAVVEKIMIDLKKGNAPALLIAIVVSTIAIGWQQYRFEQDQMARQEALKAEPVDNFFQINNVSVPNFIEGEDPNIIYDRQVKKPFYATWNVEIHRAGEATDYAYCTGNGTNLYTPKEQLPDAGVKLSWFVGKICNLPPGQYTAQTNWEIRPEGYPTKQATYSSNLFRVLPKGSQLYITPEQAEKLKELPAP
jgi:hypothetical protein